MQLLKSRQSGAALIIGLLILLLATVIAVASTSNATFQERMAGVEQNMNITFQAAESAIDEEIRKVASGDTSNLSNARLQYGLATPNWPKNTYNIGNSKVATNVEVRSTGDISMSSGNSIDADESSVRLTGARFEVRSSSEFNNGPRVNIIQGLEYR